MTIPRRVGAPIDVAIVDYGAGNVASVSKALRAIGAAPRLVAAASAIAAADAVVVPGVGHFGATRSLDAGWREAIRSRIAAGMPLLGICLGMQWLYEGSDEAPGMPGLGVFAGMCRRLEAGALKVPHVGWNSVRPTTGASCLFDGVPLDAAAYFTHTYAAPISDMTAAVTTHGQVFASAVEVGRVFGVQFHPEKSGVVGLTLLANFLRVVDEATRAC